MAAPCRRCGRPLTEPESLRLGYGPVCAAAEGIEHRGARSGAFDPPPIPRRPATRRQQGDLFKDLPMDPSPTPPPEPAPEDPAMLRLELDKLRAALDERWPDFEKLYIKSLVPHGGGRD